MIWIIISVLVTLSAADSMSPSWQTTSYIQCFTLALITTNTTTTSQNYTFTSFTPLSTGRPSAFLGILNWQLYQGDLSQLTFNISHTSQSDTQFRIRTQLNNNTSVSSLIVGMLLQDAANFSSINVNRLSSGAAFTNISTGTGNRYDTYAIAFSLGEIDLTHANFMIPCLTSINMISNGSNFFALKVTMEIVNATHYYYNFSTSGNNAVYNASFYRIIYDQTLIQQSKYHYLDVSFLIANNNLVTQNVSFIYSKPNNFVAGINAFNYSTNQIIQFNFSVQTFAFTNKYTYYHVNITCWNYRYRQCPSSYTYYLEESNLCYNICPAGYYTDNDYNFCSACHPTCLNCTNSTINSCSACNTTVRELNASNYCVCKAGTYSNSNNTCTQCSVPCITCSNASTCLTCNTTGGMVLSNNTCVCNAGGTLAPSGTFCYFCSLISPGCVACSATACTVCNTSANFYRNGSVCLCNSNYYLNSSNACQACPALTNCIVCKNATSCAECATGLQSMNGVCKCKSPYQFLNASSKCQDCVSPCSTCSNLTYCLTCQNTSNTLLNGVCCAKIYFGSDTSKPCTINECPVGYSNSTGQCKQICGDGILFDLECDDGNLDNGDGCSSDCKVQTNYTCINGSSTTPSLCSYNKPLDLGLISATKNISANTVVFQISVGPALKVLDTFNFSEIISTNIPNSDTVYKYENGVLTVSVDYNQSIQQKNVTLVLSPPTTFNNTFDMKLSNSQFVVYPENLPAYYYEETVYKESSALNTLMTVALGIGVLLCGMFTRKMIGLELMSVIQISFFSLSLTSTLHPIFTIWGRQGYISNGFSTLPQNINKLFTIYVLPLNLQAILYKPQYLQNINWMFLAELVVFILGLITLLVGKYTYRIISDAGYFMLKDILMTFVFFNTLNAAFSFGLQIYSMTLTSFGQGQLACDFIGIGVTLGFNCLVLYTYFKYTEMFQDELIMLKLNRSSTVHPFVFCIYRSVIGFLMGIMNNKSYCIFIILSLQVGYLIYITINHPHKFNYQFARGVLNESSIIFHLLTLILYQYVLTDVYTSLNHAATSLAWIDAVMILGSAVFSGYCMFYSLITQKSMDNKIQNISNQTVQNLRTKDMIHSEQVKSALASEPSSQNQNNKVIIFSSTESRRKIMDPDEEDTGKKDFDSQNDWQD